MQREERVIAVVHLSLLLHRLLPFQAGRSSVICCRPTGGKTCCTPIKGTANTAMFQMDRKMRAWGRPPGLGAVCMHALSHSPPEEREGEGEEEHEERETRIRV